MIPFHVIKLDTLWSEQFLQCPASCKPSALGQRLRRYAPRRQVHEVYIAYNCRLIPLKHRIDRLGQLRTARFVDAASVYPREFQVLFPSKLTGLDDLRKAFLR